MNSTGFNSYCPHCGADTIAEDLFCRGCGGDLRESAAEPALATGSPASLIPSPPSSASRRGRLWVALFIVVPIVVLAAGVGIYFGLRGTSEGPWTEVILEADPGVEPATSTAMDQAVVIIQDRLDKLGAGGSEVERRGQWQISVRVPGTDSLEEALTVIGMTAMLEFYDVAQFGEPYATKAEALSVAGVTTAEDLPDGMTLVYWSVVAGNSSDQYFMVTTAAPVTGAMLKSASVGYDQNDRPKVDMEFNDEGAEAFAEVTGRLAEREAITGEVQQLAIVLDGNVESAPRVPERIEGGRVEVTGNFTYDEASTLALVLQTGALPVALEVVSQSQVPAP